MLLPVRIKRKKIVNRQDFDIHIRDAYGEEHLLFPQEEKEVMVLVTEKKKNERGRFDRGCEG